MRVLAIIEAATVTGPAKNLLRFARLARGSAEVSLAVFFRGEAPYSNPFLDAAKSAGIETEVIPERGAFDRRILGALTRTVDQQKPDLVQSHGVKSHFLVRALGLDRRIPWIAFHHGYTAVDFKMHVYNQLDRWSLRRARRVVTVCAPFACELRRIGVARERIEIVPNAIEPWIAPSAETVQMLRDRLKIAPEERVVLSIGRFSREKGHIDLVAAARELRRLNPGLRFRMILAGDGAERGSVRAAAAVLGDCFVFPGQVADVSPLFAIADAFVLPSRSEGSPNVLLEAMAAGVPVAATAVGGVPETVRDEWSALLAPPRDPAALALRIARLLEDPGLAARLRANAVETARERSPERHCDAVLKVYRNVLSRAG